VGFASGSSSSFTVRADLFAGLRDFALGARNHGWPFPASFIGGGLRRWWDGLVLLWLLFLIDLLMLCSGLQWSWRV
jgi:hypothetical protein